ncbi:hypothetical protein [Flavobacterium album]|nr:hypothetical protein [Flavobacterium album]
MKKHIIFLLFIGLNLYSQDKGIEIYTIKTINNSEKDCNNCFDISKEILSGEPLLKTTDIDHFDWEKQQFILNDTGREKVRKLDIPMDGLPVVFVINDEPIYGFWLWHPLSSHVCDRVLTYPNWSFELEFGLPNDGFGSDPRYDARIKKYLNIKD